MLVGEIRFMDFDSEQSITTLLSRLDALNKRVNPTRLSNPRCAGREHVCHGPVGRSRGEATW